MLDSGWDGADVPATISQITMRKGKPVNQIQRLLLLTLSILTLSGCAVSRPLAGRVAPAWAQILTQSGPESAQLAVQLGRAVEESARHRAPSSALPGGATVCPFVSFDEAITIAMEVVPTTMDGDAGFCGYGGLVARMLEDADPLALGTTYGVAAGFLTGDTALSFFQRMATALNQDTGQANQDVYATLMAMLSEGDLTYAVAGLNETLLAVDDWITFDLGEEGSFPGMAFVRPEADGGPFIMFVGRDLEQRTLLVVAHVGEDSYPTLVMQGLYGIADRLVSGDGLIEFDDAVPQRNSACSYLSPAYAEAILGGAAENFEATADQCGYYLEHDSEVQEAFSSAMLLFARGDEAVGYLDQLAADLEGESVSVDPTAREPIDEFLAQGDLRGALSLIPDFAARQTTLQITSRPDVGDTVLYVTLVVDSTTVHTLVAVHPNGDLILLNASLFQSQDQARADSLLAAIMQELLASEGVAGVAPDTIISAPADPAPVVQSTPPAPVISPEERLDSCYGLQPEDAEAVLGEAVSPEFTIDGSYGYCIYAGVAADATSRQDDLLPPAGPLGAHPYLAVTVSPVGSATDPIMYLAYAILDRDHARLNAFLGDFYGSAALAELATAESGRPNLSREFLAEVGDGALWYWQESTTGGHLAGIYALSGAQRVVVQTLVDATRSQDDVRSALVDLVNRLMLDTQ